MAVSIGMICFLRDMTFGRNMCLSFGTVENASYITSSLPT